MIVGCVWMVCTLFGLVSASQILGLLGLYKVRSGWVVVGSYSQENNITSKAKIF